MQVSLRVSCAVLCFVLATLMSAHAVPPPPANYQVSTSAPELQNEEQICVNPTDSTNLVAVWRDFRLGYRQVAIGRSTDGGNTWTDWLISPDDQIFTHQSDPVLTVDAAGTFYAGVLDYRRDVSFNDSSIIAIHKSTDGGLTWDGPYTVTDTIGPWFEDKEFITVDRTSGPHSGNLYVAWTRVYDATPNKIMFARSTTGAISFDDTIAVASAPDFSYCGQQSNTTGQFAFPLVGSDGNVHVFFLGPKLDSSLCIVSTGIQVTSSTDGGQSFGPVRLVRSTVSHTELIDGTIDVYASPICDADLSTGPFGGNLYVCYADRDSSNHAYQDWNVYCIRSEDAASTWSEPVIVNDDPTGEGAIFDQFHPWLTVNDQGVLVIIFYDQRNDPIYHTSFDLYAAYSFDAGETFTVNQRISDVSSNPADAKTTGVISDAIDSPTETGNPSRAGKIAEYIGVTTFKDHINAVWTDIRNGNQDVFGANWDMPQLEPRLLTMVDTFVTTAATPFFEWATSWYSNDDRYILEVADDSLFLNIVYNTEVDTNYISCSTCPLTGGTWYYWRARTVAISTDDTSEYSSTGIFGVSDAGDSDGDGYPDDLDNCPMNYNPLQEDLNQDGEGDSCDVDIDGDGVVNASDNCVLTYNPLQEDTDNDGIGDSCDVLTPAVVSTVPPLNALNVDPSGVIQIEFSLPMDTSTLNSETVRIDGSRSGPVVAAMYYDEQSLTLNLTPQQSFAYGEEIVVTVTDSALTTLGGNLPSGFALSFDILTQNGSGNFALPVVHTLGGSLYEMVVSDFDSDSDPDIVVVNRSLGRLRTLINDGSGGLSWSFEFLEVGTFPVAVCGADFDRDGLTDLAVANSGSNDISLLSGLGGLGFTPETRLALGLFPSSITAGDLNGDGYPDLLVTLANEDSLAILLNDRTGSFPTITKYATGDQPVFIRLADIDQDGDLDPLCVNKLVGSVRIFINSGDGISYSTRNHDADDFTIGLAPIDIDSDGDRDFVCANDDVLNLFVYKNSGTGTFTFSQQLFTVGYNTTDIDAGDVDSDGDLDVLLLYQGVDAFSVIDNDGTGTFTEVDRKGLDGETPRDIQCVDMDGDGDLDVVTSQGGTGDIEVFFNLDCVDSDGDGFGDPGHPENICDPDNCPLDFNPDQLDSDGDGIGDLCDQCPADSINDPDADSICTSDDNCPNVYNPGQEDLTNDGIGDACCCIPPIRGNINYDSQDGIDISDLTNMVTYMFKGDFVACLAETDVDGSGSIDIADLTYLVGYMFKSGPDPASCPSP